MLILVEDDRERKENKRMKTLCWWQWLLSLLKVHNLGHRPSFDKN
jgi:hypothetical protein